MDFDWIKKIFKKRIESNTNTSDVATIDTSFVYVPKFDELTNEEKSKVLKELDSLKNNNEYNTILKFSSDLVDISNRERFILTKTLERYHEWFRLSKNPSSKKTDKEKLGDSICFGLLSNLEFENIVQNLLSVKEQLKIKAVAIDLFLAKKSKERKRIKEIFRPEDRQEYLTLKNRLLSEKERIKVSMKINDQILRTIYIDIKENDSLRKEYCVLEHVLDNTSENTSILKKYIIKSLESKLYHYSHEFIGTDFNEEFKEKLKNFGEKLIGMKTPNSYIEFKKTSFDLYNNQISETITKEMIDEVLDNALKGGEDYTFSPLLNIIQDNMLGEFFKFVADIFHNMEVFCYDHKEDYKKYIEEIKAIIDECESTPTKDWNEEKIASLSKTYNYKIYCYFNLLKNYLNEDNKTELMDVYSKLLFLCKLKCYKEYQNLDSWIDKYYKINDYEYELLTKVEKKYGVSLYEDNDKKARNDFIYDFRDYLIYLYDLLQGNTDILKTNIHLNDSIIKKISHLVQSSRFNNLFDDEINTNDYYYLFKLLKIPFDEICDISMSSDNLLENKEACDTDFAKFLTKIKLVELDDEYDDRIIVIPKSVAFSTFYQLNQELKFTKSVSSIDFLKTNDNQIAIFLSNSDQIHRISYDSQTIKYIILKEETLEDYEKNYLKYLKERYQDNGYYDDTWTTDVLKECILNKKIKLIIVPNETKFNELSEYLDQEIEKEKEEQKQLKKII